MTIEILLGKRLYLFIILELKSRNSSNGVLQNTQTESLLGSRLLMLHMMIRTPKLLSMIMIYNSHQSIIQIMGLQELTLPLLHRI